MSKSTDQEGNVWEAVSENVTRLVGSLDQGERKKRKQPGVLLPGALGIGWIVPERGEGRLREIFRFLGQRGSSPFPKN